MLQAGAARLDDHVRWQREIVFEASEASSAVQVFFDPAGFVVADAGQGQVRAYSPAGGLLWAQGQTGPGPAEFQRLRAAVRTPAAEVLAVDNAGKLVVYAPDGSYQTTITTGLIPSYGALLLNDTTMLISGRKSGNAASPLLHTFDLRTRSIRSSFFTVPAHDPVFDEAYRFSGWANAAVVGNDSLAVVFALSDTLYLYRFDGSPISKHPLPLQHFRPVRQPGPRNASPEAEVEWRNSYTRISDVFPGPGNTVFIQYFNLQQVEPVWGLAQVELGADGVKRRFEVPKAPRLLGVSRPSHDLVFLQPETMDSVKWSVAQLAH